MTSVAAIRTAIADKLRAVPDIGRVHEYERYARNDSGFAALYRSGEQIRGWYVRLVGARETSPAIGRHVSDHDWQIRGVMALQDESATELQFDDLVEAIAAAFRADETLGDVVATTILPARAGIQLIDSSPAMFAGTLCHFTRLGLTTRFYR